MYNRPLKQTDYSIKITKHHSDEYHEIIFHHWPKGYERPNRTICMSNIKSFMKDLVEKKFYTVGLAYEYLNTKYALDNMARDNWSTERVYLWFCVIHKLVLPIDVTTKNCSDFVPTLKGYWVAYLGKHQK